MRKFGVEIELNSFDQRNFKLDPLDRNETPLGIQHVADVIKKSGQDVRIENWQNTHNNVDWVCKPDASCGIEVCSPVIDDIDKLTKVIDLFSIDPNLKVDDRCSFHVHFSIEDCVDKKDVFGSEKLAAILSWWVKCEPVFFDSVPNFRKMNRYCQFIGISELFEFEELVRPTLIIKKLGSSKYFSANVHHFYKKNRSTIEFRIGEYDLGLNSNSAKNWILLLSHFIDRCILKGLPDNFSWLNPVEVFEFLDLNNMEIKNWFLNRIITNINSEFFYFNYDMRKQAIEQLKTLQLDKD
jgi:hypothetical protein